MTEKTFTKTGGLKNNYFLKDYRWYWLTLLLSVGMIFVILLLPDSSNPAIILRYGFAGFFLFFIPGFTIMRLLFPQAFSGDDNSSGLDIIERVGLSILVSVALIPILGIILNYTVFGITLVSMLTSLVSLTLFLATALFIRQYSNHVKK
jgi:uncharacterized membrane protein